MIKYESILELWRAPAEGEVMWGMVGRSRGHWGQFVAVAVAQLVAPMGVEIAAVVAVCGGPN